MYVGEGCKPSPTYIQNQRLLKKIAALFNRAAIFLPFNNWPYYSIGRPAAVLSLITPVSSTKKTLVPVTPIALGVAVQVY